MNMTGTQSEREITLLAISRKVPVRRITIQHQTKKHMIRFEGIAQGVFPARSANCERSIPQSQCWVSKQNGKTNSVTKWFI